ncbi:amidohydrolase family protein [Dokdonia donghaensis]|uniref:Amidohydrolase n=1 Tax=Dokdonia donghaensis DSW-1 TaxID=1300343 RepID=A0A0A2GSV9_9FLAO|nr:amidohydrolase family protein [Dokdonia donghaensis]ANH61177.1 dihydroorotase [Dokdonia donghaensis DSW-1]KGO05613.1 amidohydrolase [Dokdonia donghaensis DSW-1]
MKTLLLTLLLVITSISSAQGDFVINNVTLFNGEEILENRSVAVSNGTITKVSKRPQKAETIIDGQGKFLMPALTNAHVHTWALPQLKEAAQAGVLNLLDMHGMEPMQKAMVDARTSLDGARLYRAGYAATTEGGHGSQYGFPIPTLSKSADAETWVNDRVAAGVDYIKIIVEPWKKTLDKETVAQIIKEAHKASKIAVVHVSNEEDAYNSLISDADGLVHIYHDKPMTDQHLQELVEEKDFFVIPTILTTVLIQPLYFNKTKEETALIEANLLKEVKRLYDAGIPILAGTDPPNANINIGSDLYKELAFFAKAGLPIEAVLASATSLPAEKFFLEGVGYIKKGYKADLLLLEQSPVNDVMKLNTLSHIWKEGTLVEQE